ncbi:hypothetical protein NFI96_010487, partial [Prochilodus magdalenae]
DYPGNWPDIAAKGIRLQRNKLNAELFSLQVKKSKKWCCKMCGEKQSLIKEFGRGTGADCRRHVQKLNSLRGELLQVENDKACIQWEKEKECEDEDSCGDGDQSCEQQNEMQVLSRWSKYVDQTDSRTRDEEEEEENIYTERARFRSCDKISRKRKKNFTTVSDEDDPGSEPAQARAKGMPFQAHQRGGSFRTSTVAYSNLHHSSKVPSFTTTNAKTASSSSSDSSATPLTSKHSGVYSGINATGGIGFGANKKASVGLTTKCLSSVPASDSCAPSSCFQRSRETTLEAQGSKWARFLTSVPTEENKDELDGEEEEDDNCAQISSGVTDAAVTHSQSAFIPVPTPRRHLSSNEGTCVRAPLDEVLGLGNRSTTSVFEKLSRCMTGITSSSPSTFTSQTAGSQSPVCLQPLPIKRPCPALSFSTLFHTDEDFDDAL